MATSVSTWLRGKVTDVKDRIGHEQHRNAFSGPSPAPIQEAQP